MEKHENRDSTELAAVAGLQGTSNLMHVDSGMDAMTWTAQPIHMMDFEGSASSGVVEYGIVSLKGGRITHTDTAICAPSGEITVMDQQVHGLYPEQVTDKKPFASHYAKFVQLRQSGIFAAHNRHAENNFLKGQWAVPPIVPDWRTGQGLAQEWGPWVDTLAVYKGIYRELPSYSLGALVDQFRLRDQLADLARDHCPVERSKPHCALYDAIASALLLLRLESEASLRPYLSLHWILQFSNGISPQRELF